MYFQLKCYRKCVKVWAAWPHIVVHHSVSEYPSKSKFMSTQNQLDNSCSLYSSVIKGFIISYLHHLCKKIKKRFSFVLNELSRGLVHLYPKCSGRSQSFRSYIFFAVCSQCVELDLHRSACWICLWCWLYFALAQLSALIAERGSHWLDLKTISHTHQKYRLVNFPKNKNLLQTWIKQYFLLLIRIVSLRLVEV